MLLYPAAKPRRSANIRYLTRFSYASQNPYADVTHLWPADAADAADAEALPCLMGIG